MVNKDTVTKQEEKLQTMTEEMKTTDADYQDEQLLNMQLNCEHNSLMTLQSLQVKWMRYHIKWSWNNSNEIQSQSVSLNVGINGTLGAFHCRIWIKRFRIVVITSQMKSSIKRETGSSK